MNDDFLHRLREAPPPEFAARLKARLDAMPGNAAPARRVLTLRGLMLGFLIGGTAFAVTAISIRGVPPAIERWFAPEPTPPSTSVTPTLPSSGPPSPAPRQVFPGEMVVPQESSRALTTAPQPSSRAPVQLTSQPVERPDTDHLPALSSESLPLNAGPDGSRRDFVKVVVAQATQPFAKLIADDLSRSQQPGSVKIESQGNGGALKSFCDGPDFFFPDVAITSRRMRPEELQACWRNGVRVVHEINIGRQAVVLVQNLAGPELKFSSREIFMALARRTPDLGEPTRIATNNTATMWPQVTPIGIGIPIHVLGPGDDSALHQALIDLLIEPGCRTHEWLANLRERDVGAYESICRELRIDGVYIGYGDDMAAIAQNVRGRPGAIGVLHYNYFDSHRETLAANAIDGVVPSDESIANGSYPAARILYLYLKDPNLRSIPGLMQFVTAFREAATARGRFFDLGITPAAEADRRMRTLTLQDLQPR